MKRVALLLLATLILLCLGGGCRRAASPVGGVSLGSGLRDLTNLAVFARAPAGTAGLTTSFDRTGGNSDWANLAARREGDRYVLADLKGPGCVRRIWMTNIPAEEWLFFFDGEAEPRLRFKESDLFGRADPFTPPLSDKVSNGNYCYLPLPYAKSLKICVRVADLKPDAMPFFHFNYETFPRGTRVTSFPAQVSEAEKVLLEETRAAWRGARQAAAGDAADCAEQAQATVAPGQTWRWLEQSGSGSLRRFRIRLEFPAALNELQRAQLLRALVLRMYWDGAAAPSVAAPLGDFFCNGLNAREFTALPLARVDGVYVSRFPMPFRRGARAEIENLSPVPVEVETGWTVDPSAPEPAARYFHASWNHAVSTGIPFPVLRADGAGHVVGCYLTHIGMDGSWNIFEGDDSMSIDGAPATQFHGTGLEDFFNGAWYYGAMFDLPLHGLLRKSPTRAAQYRFLAADRVPFSKSMDFQFEFGHGNAARGYMSSVAYWYQDGPVAARGAPMQLNAMYPPPDPLEPAAAVSYCNELERLGEFETAADHCLELGQRYAGAPWGEVLTLRGWGYRELLNGYAAVSDAYRAISAKRETNPEAAEQARLLMWFHEAPTNALLGVHAIGRHKVYLDGRLVVDVDDPLTLRVFPVTLAPGAHELTAEVSPTQPEGTSLIYLRTHAGPVCSDARWEYTRACPPGWPAGWVSGAEDAGWRPVEEPHYAPPWMMCWQAAPNGFVQMQAIMTRIRPWKTWLQDRQTAYLRRRFVVPDARL